MRQVGGGDWVRGGGGRGYYHNKGGGRGGRFRSSFAGGGGGRSAPQQAQGEMDRKRALFNRLMKDPKAKMMQNQQQALRFLEGMDTFDSKPQLIAMMVDDRNQGPRCIESMVGFLSTVREVEDLVVPLLKHGINEDMSKPFYRELRDRYLNMIFRVPMLLSFLNQENVVSDLSRNSAEVICLFLLFISKALVEARNSQEIVGLAKKLRDRGDVDKADTLCVVLLIEPGNQPLAAKKRSWQSEEESGPSMKGVCWVTDTIPPGGRHDNDFLNYRDVAIVPTPDELRCDVPPYLPLASGENKAFDDPVAHLLDSNFRLLREDSISSMREGIQDRKSPWFNARVIDLDMKEAHSLSFIIQVDPPHRKVTDWSRAKILLHGSIVALLDKNHGRLVRTGTISIRKEDWLSKTEGPRFGVEFDGTESFDASVREMASNKSFNDQYTTALSTGNQKRAQLFLTSMTTYELVEISKSFFSYKPVLKALQQMDQIPFHEELLSASRPAFAEHVTGVHAALDYFGGGNLVFPNDPNFKGYSCDLAGLSAANVSNNTSLDASQAEAVVHSLTSRVSLIQGPPGTGKTFIGGLFAQLVRLNTDETILCVCFTNHALDQFLEHMLDFGEKSIARLGGRSKSDRAGQYEIRSLASSKARRDEVTTSRIKQVDAQMHQKREAISATIEVLEEPVSWDSPDGGLEWVLENMAEYEFLRVPDQEDEYGFHMVGHRGKKALSADFLWKTWVKGKDFPQFMLPYIREFSDAMNEFWRRPLQARHDFAVQVEREVLASTRTALHALVNEFMDLQRERHALSQDTYLQILRDARIIGATTSGAARYRELLSEVSPSIVIVEEAGEVLEAHILASLAVDTKHLVLIGDHKQLRPKVETHKLTAVSGSGYNLDISLFERLVLGGLPSTTLAVQHRMRPSISRIIRERTYPSLLDHESVYEYPDVRGLTHNLVFIDHDHKEDGELDESQDHNRSSTTKANQYEAMLCVEIVRFLLLQGYAKDRIVVLTPYLGQLFKIIGEMKHQLKDVEAYVSEQDLDKFEGEEYDKLEEERAKQRGGSVRCSSVDNYQGEESDIVVVSLVRSNSKGSVGFLKEPQRVNVLLSRARHGMILIGNANTLVSGSGKGTWGPIFDLLNEEGQVMKGLPTVCQVHRNDDPILLSSRQQFRAYRPNGGCTRKCNYRLGCGHVCPMCCHPTDQSHTNVQCFEPCARAPPDCNRGHRCTKLCCDLCGPCHMDVGPVGLPCGHIAQSILCHDARNDEALEKRSKDCKQIVQFRFESCGHVSETTCGNARSDEPKCPELCMQMLSCDHPCQKRCGSCGSGHDCKKPCERTLFCGHRCLTKCHVPDRCPPCPNGQCGNRCAHSSCPKSCKEVCASCVEPCDWECKHRGKCMLVCGAPCNRLPCNERCHKTLACGHRCPSLCGELCPDKRLCHECGDEHVLRRVVDMIMFETYKDLDVDCDPILVLPCGHFFSVSTLDGHIEIDRVYERDGDDFITCVPLASNDVNEKGKQCPDCRAPIHSIRRYSRIINLSILRGLERKHMMDVEHALDGFSRQEPKKRDIKGLLQIKKFILSGPMKQVFDACRQLDSTAAVPSPPSKPLIHCLHLLGQTYGAKIRSQDSYLEKSFKCFDEAIQFADDSKSRYSGATVRISMARSLGHWVGKMPDLKSKIIEHLRWVVENLETGFADDLVLVKEAKELEVSLVDDGQLKEVVRAMNEVRGYNYGAGASDHWYECPNGHPYFIGECGGAMQRSQCIECGAEVGGEGHRLDATNRRWNGLGEAMNG
ncbi:hypothetical protein ACA910_008397 [Epithemia clementina (nom. ined.)]